MVGAVRDGGAPLTGKKVLLLPLTRSDYDFVFQLEALGPLSASYRFRGITPSPERFPELLWNGVLCQFVVVWRKNGQRLGTVMCFGADFRNRHAHIGAALAPVVPSPYAQEGFALFIDYLFRHFDLRKLYGDALSSITHRFSSAVGSILHEEARLKEHDYFDGSYRDLVTLAIYRDEWFALRSSHSLEAASSRLTALSMTTLGDEWVSPLAMRLRAAARALNTNLRDGHQ